MHEDLQAHLAELKSRQKALTVRRVALERKQELRDSTMAEFSAAHTDMLRRKLRVAKQNQIESKKRNLKFVSDLQEYQKQHFGTTMPGVVGRASALALMKAKQSFADQVEVVYPAWQEQMQQMKLVKLRQLEQEKRDIEYRRVLAKQSFEKEQALEMLLQQTAQDISFAATIERNEVYERQLYRQQKMKEAEDLDYIIQAKADEERRRLEDEHLKALVTAPIEQFESLAQKYAPLKMEVPSPAAVAAFRQHPADLSPPMVPTTAPAFAYATNTLGRTPRTQHHDDLPNSRPSMQEDDVSTMPFVYVPIVHTSPPPAKTTVQPESAPRSLPETAPLPQVDYALLHSASPSQDTPQPPITTAKTPPPVENISQGAVAAQLASHLSAPAASAELGKQAHSTQQPVDPPPVPIMTWTEQPPATASPAIHTREGPNDVPKEGESRGEEMADSILADYVQMTQSTDPTPLLVVQQVVTGGAHQLEASIPPPAIEQQDSDGQTSLQPLAMASNTAEVIVPPQPSPPRAVERAPDVAQASPPKHPPARDIIEALPPVVVGENSPNEASPMESPDIPDSSLSHQTVDFKSAGDSVEPPASDHALPLPTLNDPANDDLALSIMHNISADTTNVQGATSDARGASPADVAVDQDSVLESSVASESGHVAFFDNLAPSPSLASMPTSEAKDASDSRKAPALVGMSLSIDESFDLSQSGMAPSVQDSTNVSLASATNHSIASSSLMPSPIKSSGQPPDILVLDASASPDKPIPRMTSAFSTHNDLDESTNSNAMADEADDGDGYTGTTATFNLTVNERLTVLQALIPRIEDTTKDGEHFSPDFEAGIEMKSKQDLLKMAMGGRKAQIGFFGGDVCFALLLDVCRDAAPYLFPERIFEGKMTEQKLVKEYKSCREKELEYWKALSGHFKQLVGHGAMRGDQLIDLLVGIFLAHLNNDPRSTRKLKEFLAGHVGSGVSKPQPTPSKQVETPKPSEPVSKLAGPKDAKLNEAKSVLDLAFMQSDSSPPKRKAPEKELKLAKSPISASGGLGQRVLRGVNLGEISEFDDDDNIDFNKIMGPLSKASAKPAALARAYTTTKETKKPPRDDDFDEDF